MLRLVNHCLLTSDSKIGRFAIFSPYSLHLFVLFRWEPCYDLIIKVLPGNCAFLIWVFNQPDPVEKNNRNQDVARLSEINAEGMPEKVIIQELTQINILLLTRNSQHRSKKKSEKNFKGKDT